MLTLSLLGFGGGALYVAAGWFISRHADKDQKAFDILNHAGYNIGVFVIPFTQQFLGTAGVMTASIFDVGNAFICLGGAYGVAAAVKDGKGFDFKRVVKALSVSVPFLVHIGTVIMNSGAISATVVADALAGLTKISADDITAYAVGNTSCSVANLEKLVDGVYHAADAVSSGDVTMNFSSFAANAYDDNLNNVGGATKPGAKYFAYYAFELANATAIKGFRLSANDYSSSNSKYSFCLQGVSILVSADGQTWTNVANYYDMVDQGLYVDVADAIRDYYEASGSLTNTAAVKYVALCVPGAEKPYNDRANVQNGLPQYGSGSYVHHLELELYY